MADLLRKKTFLNFFPAPEYLLLSSSGIAISDEEIRFVEFRRGLFTHNLKLADYTKIPLLAGVVEAGFINDQARLTASLKELSLKYGLRYVRATLPDEKSYLFTAIIDKVPSAGLRDAVAFIIEENVPVTLADSIFDFDVVKEIAESSQLKIAVSVLAKKTVDGYIAALEGAGLTPVSFDIESQAIARAVVARGDLRTQLIINFGDKKTGFYVVEDGVVQFTTTLARATDSNNPYGNASDLKMEMRKIFAFWNARTDKRGFPEGKIERVLLCGKALLKEDLVKELMSESPVEYSMADVWINAADFREKVSPVLAKESLEYVSAIGLVLPRPEKTYV